VRLVSGRGVEGVVGGEFRRYDHLREVQVNSSFAARESQIPPEDLAVQGIMSDAKRERIRRAMVRWWSRKNIVRPTVPLTAERLRAIAAPDHVQAVVPFIIQGRRAFLGEHSHEITSSAAGPHNRHAQARLVAGEFFRTDHERSAVVHEYLLYLWGITSEEDVQRVIGQKLRVEFHLGLRPPALLLFLLGGGRAELSAE